MPARNKYMQRVVMMYDLCIFFFFLFFFFSIGTRKDDPSLVMRVFRRLMVQTRGMKSTGQRFLGNKRLDAFK